MAKVVLNDFQRGKLPYFVKPNGVRLFYLVTVTPLNIEKELIFVMFKLLSLKVVSYPIIGM